MKGYMLYSKGITCTDTVVQLIQAVTCNAPIPPWIAGLDVNCLTSMQFPSDPSETAAKNCSSACNPANHTGNSVVVASWLQPGPNLAIVDIWEMDQSMKDVCITTFIITFQVDED